MHGRAPWPLSTFRYITAVLFAIVSATAAELHVMTISPDPQTFEVSLSLYSPGQAVSSLQFDMSYDANLLTVISVQAADGVATQSKQLLTSRPETGVVRIVIVGMNKYPLLNARLVTVAFGAADKNADATGIRVTKMKAAGPEGDEVPLVAARTSPAPRPGPQTQRGRRR
jgi:hypothetical protein